MTPNGRPLVKQSSEKVKSEGFKTFSSPQSGRRFKIKMQNEMSPLETKLQWAKVIGGAIGLLLLFKIAFFP